MFIPAKFWSKNLGICRFWGLKRVIWGWFWVLVFGINGIILTFVAQIIY